MNRRAIAALVVVAALAILAAILGVKLLSGAIGFVRSGSGSGAPDPQFAEPTETVTRPPELADEDGAPVADDPSAGWDIGEQTPVDMTAEELAREMGESG